MDFELEELLDYVRENLLTVLAVATMLLLVIAYLIFTMRIVIPRWRLHTDLATQFATAEAAFADRSGQQQQAAGVVGQQIEAAHTQFNQTVNRFLTEAQAATLLDSLFNSAAAVGVTIVDLQAQTVLQGAAGSGEKPAYDTRLFRLVVEGDLPRLSEFVGRIKETAVPSINLQNLLITSGEDGLPDVLTLDLLLYTSPFSNGEAIAQLPDSSVPVPLATQPAQVVPTATAKPDVSRLLAQLDDPWAAENWPEVIRLIQEIRQQAPSEPEMAEKLYAARVNYGYQLAGLGETAAAAEQFEQALALFPDGGEAEAGLQSLFAPTPTATPSVIIYVVQRGDTLFSIARRYDCTVDAVKAANGLVGNNITPGQQLIIP